MGFSAFRLLDRPELRQLDHILNRGAWFLRHRTFHRGIAYSVKEIDETHWQWKIHPPTSVLGLMPKSGFAKGTQADAIDAAKREIEAQDRQQSIASLDRLIGSGDARSEDSVGGRTAGSPRVVPARRAVPEA
jgi:hypothetical protein